MAGLNAYDHRAHWGHMMQLYSHVRNAMVIALALKQVSAEICEALSYLSEVTE